MADGVPLGRVDEQIARRLWWAALDTLQDQILLPMDLKKGLWLASPLPALYESRLLEKLEGWVWVPEELPLINCITIPLGRSLIASYKSFKSFTFF